MTILILAGTGEGRQIAGYCADQNINAIASLAGTTRAPKPLPLPTRHGGFGGGDGFLRYLSEHSITAVLDMTHPFAARITQRSFTLCDQKKIPFLRFERPCWQSSHGDFWTHVADDSHVAAHVSRHDTVFLATGRQTLDHYAGLSASQIYCRQIDTANGPFPFEGGEYVIGRPPFSVEDEIALFQKLGVSILVVKNAGGAASRSKLDAARALGIRVIMIDRPPASAAPCTSQLGDVKTWLQAQA